MYQRERDARKAAIALLGLDSNISYVDLVKKIAEDEKVIIDFDATDRKKCAKFVYVYMDRKNAHL